MMGSERTFRDGCVSFKDPHVTSIRYFEPDKVKSWSSSVLDKIRFEDYVEKSKTILLPVLERKIRHLKNCNLKHHYDCNITSVGKED